MTRFDFSPEMQEALDACEEPILPGGFAERVVARALAEAGRIRPPVVRHMRWRRSRRIVVGVAAGALLAATAAAAGLFGKRIYVPIISEVVEKLRPVSPPDSSEAGLTRPVQVGSLSPEDVSRTAAPAIDRQAPGLESPLAAKLGDTGSEQLASVPQAAAEAVRPPPEADRSRSH